MRHTWTDAVKNWRAENINRTAKWQYDEAGLLRWLGQYLDPLDLSEIGPEQIAHIRREAIQAGLSAYSVNARLAVIRAVMRAACDWGWIQSVPRFRFMKRPPPAVRHITPDQAATLLANLPPHTRDIAAFSLETGLRKKNAAGLQWCWIDLRHRVIHIPAMDAKGRRPLAVPLSERAAAIVDRWQGVDPVHVFTYRGAPVAETNTKAYKRACAVAGLGRFRWHDLRHTWASWHAMSGTPLLVLQQLGGWNTVQMVNNYAHLQIDGLRPWVANLDHWKGAA